MVAVELTLTVSTAEHVRLGRRRILRGPLLPGGTLNRPRNNVLQATEDSSTVLSGFGDTKAILRGDVGVAPGAGLATQRR